jgi:cohesin loading factor subunit SCC2
MGACCRVYEKLVDLFVNECGLVESLVSQVLSLAISSLSVDGVVQMQLSASKVVEAIVASYPEHDKAVIDDLCEQLSKLPPNRRALRMCRVDGGSKYVRVASAILVRVLNVIGGRNETRIDVPSSAAKRSGSVELLPSDMRNRCLRFAFRVAEETLMRAFRDRDAELRAALQALFTDLLELYSLPEWPAAELLVQALGVRLVIMLRNDSDMSVYARSTSLDLLGALAARVCVLFGDSALQTDNGDNGAGLWTDVAYRNDVVKRRALVVSYLRERAKTDPCCEYAQLFHCVQFAVDDGDACKEDCKLRARREHLEDAGNRSDVDGEESLVNIPREELTRVRREAMELGSHALTESLQHLKASASSHSRDDVVAALQFICQRRSFGRQLFKVIDTIRDGLLQPEPTLRARAIKALSAVVEAEPTVLKNVPTLLTAIESSCMDVSKSVREASLDLLSRSVSAPSGCVGENDECGSFRDARDDASVGAGVTLYGAEYSSAWWIRRHPFESALYLSCTACL